MGALFAKVDRFSNSISWTEFRGLFDLAPTRLEQKITKATKCRSLWLEHLPEQIQRRRNGRSKSGTPLPREHENRVGIAPR